MHFFVSTRKYNSATEQSKKHNTTRSLTRSCVKELFLSLRTFCKDFRFAPFFGVFVLHGLL